MKFVSARIITTTIDELAKFYDSVRTIVPAPKPDQFGQVDIFVGRQAGYRGGVAAADADSPLFARPIAIEENTVRGPAVGGLPNFVMQILPAGRKLN
jgi:hypothetical protein